MNVFWLPEKHEVALLSCEKQHIIFTIEIDCVDN